MICAAVIMSCNDNASPNVTSSDAATDASSSNKEPAPAEFADAKYTERIKASQAAFQAGNVDKWAEDLSDNAVYVWSAGDSVAGKAAIVKYWKDRFANVIESLKFSSEIFLPVKINKPQQGPDLKGTWVLSWYKVEAKYKTGKSVTFWVHHDNHFGDDDKIDRLITYYDRAPIIEATK